MGTGEISLVGLREVFWRRGRKEEGVRGGGAEGGKRTRGGREGGCCYSC